MGIVGQNRPNRPFWTNEPLYDLNDCGCGASQYPNRDVYTVYVGPGQGRGFWVVKCRLCGRTVKGKTQAFATEKWNRGDGE